MKPTYNEIKPFLDAGKTSAEIAAQYTALKVTVNPIQLSALTDLLNKRGVLTRRVRVTDSGEKWSGTANAMILYVEQNGTPEQVSLVGKWFSHITNPRLTSWDTSLPEWGIGFDAIRQAFADQPGMPTGEDFGAIINLGGGYKYAALTEADIQSVIDDEAHRIAENERQARWDEALPETHVNRVYQDFVLPFVRRSDDEREPPTLQELRDHWVSVADQLLNPLAPIPDDEA